MDRIERMSDCVATVPIMAQTPIQRPARTSASRRPPHVVLPVHDPALATYAVACDGVPEDPDSALWAHLPIAVPMDLLPTVLAVAASGTVRTHVIQGAQLRTGAWDRADCPDCADGDPVVAARGRGAASAILVYSRGRPGDGLDYIWAALAGARALSFATSGVLLDTATDQMLVWSPFDDPRSDPLDVRRRTSTSSWLRVNCSRGSGRRLWMTTTGLERFGLPELSLGGVNASARCAAMSLLLGVGHWLLSCVQAELGQDSRPLTGLTIPTEHEITACMQRAACPADEAHASVSDAVVRLRLRRQGPDPHHVMIEVTVP